jgi:hypothetical protein
MEQVKSPEEYQSGFSVAGFRCQEWKHIVEDKEQMQISHWVDGGEVLMILNKLKTQLVGKTFAYTSSHSAGCLHSYSVSLPVHTSFKDTKETSGQYLWGKVPETRTIDKILKQIKPKKNTNDWRKSCGVSDPAEQSSAGYHTPGSNFKYQYFRDFETEFNNILECEFPPI